VLKKPFSSVEALQIACALSEKWTLTRQARTQLADTERIVEERTRALRETEQRFRQIAENIEGIFWMATPDLRETLYLSPGAERILGRSQASLAAEPRSWLGHAQPEDEEVARQFFEQVAAGESAESELRVAHGDGGTRWLRNRCFPVRDEGGQFVRVCGIAEDITARREADEERRMMELQLRHAQKMESIGQLAAGIAHEINTPTQYIGDNMHFVQDGFRDLGALLAAQGRLLAAVKAGAVPPELVTEVEAAAKTADVEYLAEEMPKAIDQSLQGVKRVAKIVGAMKEFSHPGTNEKTPIDLNRAIESTVTVATNEWKYVADLVTEFDPALPQVPCLPGEFNQVILNIVVNASHAIGDVVGDGAKGKGTITISTRLDGDAAEIRIRDSGTGMPEHVKARIFDPFFTTKGVGRGTGQGLAIAHSVMVDKHGGSIRVESEPGKGTTFILRLPLQAAVAEKKAA
jgi:PAS domain S-box-containing protein